MPIYDRPVRVLLVALAGLALGACKEPKPKSLASVSEQLKEQFGTQHAANKSAAQRKLLSAYITGFEAPSGNPRPYLGIALAWEDTTTLTSVPLIQLGDALFGVTYSDPTTKEELSAILSFR